MTTIAELRAAVGTAAAGVVGSGPAPAAAPTLERPPRPDFGDYSTNAALLLAPVVGESPRAVAERLGGELEQRLGPLVDRVEVAGPGFLNLFLTDDWFRAALAHVLGEGERHGAGGAPEPLRVDIEFVSANPTGPLHVAHGRHAAFGDALARILAFHGHQVNREFYVNDHGTQVRLLAESVRARARGEEPPEGGYKGDYVSELVPREQALELDLDELARSAVAACLERIEATLERFGVPFDTWYSESKLHEGEPDAVEAVLARLEAQGQLYHHEGAQWLRTTAYGDDKDRVLVRSSGERTYFASDVAYHQDKLARGFERLIDVWGADHHGYQQRMHAAFEALGGSPEALEIVILQFVHLFEGGGRASMSKRRGEFVTLDELIDQIGVDAARFFLLARSADTTVEVDLDLAREESNENPVYYVQYAHARIASVLAKAGAERVREALAEATAAAAPEQQHELHPAERALIKKLVAFPEDVAEAAERRAPHRIAAYALELAQEFTAFYRDCRIVGAEPHATESFRIALGVAAQRTIAQALALLGVSAPDEM